MLAPLACAAFVATALVHGDWTLRWRPIVRVKRLLIPSNDEIVQRGEAIHGELIELWTKLISNPDLPFANSRKEALNRRYDRIFPRIQTIDPLLDRQVWGWLHEISTRLRQRQTAA